MRKLSTTTTPHAQIITQRAELERWAPAWQGLLNASRPEAMQSPDWLLPWWDVYAAGSDRELRVVLFWAGAELVGLAPLLRRSFRYRGGLRFRRIELLGSDADENDGVCSEYLGFIALPSWESRVVGALTRQLRRGALGAWDEVVFSALDGTRAQTKLLAGSLEESELAPQIEETTTAPFVTLPASWDAYLKQLSKSKRWNLKTQLKDFDAWSEGKTVWQEARTEDELEQGKRILADLHETRWRAEGKTGVFSASRFLRFHDRFMKAKQAKGNLELLWLEKAGLPIAALYAFREAGRVYFYQSGRVMDLPDRVRIGSVVVAQALRRAIERGDREFDLLGGPARYKLAFTQTTRPIVRIRVARPSLFEAMRKTGEAVLRGARRARAWWRGSDVTIIPRGEE